MNPLFKNHKIRRVLECGSVVAMNIDAKPTKKAVFQGLFREPALIDSEYFPDPLKDDQSEADVLLKLMAHGYYGKPEYELTANGYRLTWRATESGKRLIEEFRRHDFAPQRDPHAMARATAPPLTHS